MGTYFKSEYQQYYDTLGDAYGLKTSSNNMSATCEALKTELQGVYALFSELSGDYSSSLLESFQGLNDVIAATVEKVDNDLPKAVDAMSTLHDDLTDLKPKDEDYDDKKDELDGYGGEPTQYKYNEDGTKYTNPSYTSYKELEAALKELAEKCEKLVKDSDSQIDIIKAFNDTIVEMRMRIASFEYAQQNGDFADFDSLTIAEKEAFIQDLINQMTEKYNEYKTAYEKYARFTEHMTEEQLDAFSSILIALGIAGDQSVVNGMDGEYTPFGFNFFYDDDYTDAATRGLAMLDLLVLIDKNKVLEKVDNYMNKGQSWEESGMQDLYIDFYPGLGGMFEADKEMFIARLKENGEDSFWDSVEFNSSYFNRNNKEEYAKAFKEAVDIFRVDAEGFKDNYMKAGNAAIAAQGLKEMNKHLRYDALTQDVDYQSFEPTWDPVNNPEDRDRLDNLWYDSDNAPDSDYYEWMNNEERKTLEYLYNENPEKAKEYMESMDSTIKQRKGFTAAKDFYDSVHDGSNQDLDAVVDHLRSFGRGGVTGVYTFGENISSLFDPAADYSQNDYFHMSMVSMLNSKDPYDKGLLLAYNLGEASGEVAVPLVVGLFSKTAGTALATAGAVGKDMRNTSIEMHTQGRNVTYEQLLATAGLRNVATGAIKKFTGEFDGPDLVKRFASSVVSDSTKNVLGNNDVMFDTMFGRDETSRAIEYRQRTANQDSIIYDAHADGATMEGVLNVGSTVDGSIKGSIGKTANEGFGTVLGTVIGNEQLGKDVASAFSPVTNAATGAVYDTAKEGLLTAANADDGSAKTEMFDPYDTFQESFSDNLLGKGDKYGQKAFNNAQSMTTGAYGVINDYKSGAYKPGD